jgi:predicted HTH transcriptional regulator
MAGECTAFANAYGGVILFGVKDNGEIVGILPEHLAIVQQWIENICQNNCDPPLNPIITKMLLPNAAGVPVTVIKAEILRSIFAHATSGGLWYHRVGSSKQKLSPQALARRLQQRSQGYAFEEKTIPQARFDDIDIELYKKHHELRQLGPLDESILPISDLLVNLKIAGREEGKVLPTVVGLLMFGKHPQKYLPNATIDCAIYSGSVPDSNCLINVTPCTGTLAEQIVRASEFVKRYEKISGRKPLYEEVGEAVKLTIYGRPNPNRPQLTGEPAISNQLQATRL